MHDVPQGALSFVVALVRARAGRKGLEIDT